MKRCAFAAVLALSACVETAVPLNPPPSDLAQRAYFPAFPENLFVAAARACTDPGQTVLRPSQTQIRCESLPDPRTAAAIILSFDGTVQEIPRIVFAFNAAPASDGGYIVSADSYLRVPQDTGRAQIVRFPDPVIARDVQDILKSAGGRIIP